MYILRELLKKKEKEACYATDKVDTCSSIHCDLYWTCRSYKYQLKNGKTTETREDILNHKCQ